MKPAFEIVTVKSGAKSLRCLERQETFHPGIGPLEEAGILHVDQQRLVERAALAETFVIWDVGLGAAANAIAALNALREGSAKVELHSFDISMAPLEFGLSETEALSYLAPYRETVEALVKSGSVSVTPRIRWHFHAGDFREAMLRPGIPAPQAILYDPYSAATNQEMWTLEHFSRLRPLAGEECLLTNYTRSTAVRVSLLLAGFFVGIGTGIAEKDQTTIAATRRDLLDRPLEADWLERVRVSGNGGPVTGSAYEQRPITAEELALLQAHPQFAGRPAGVTNWPARDKRFARGRGKRKGKAPLSSSG